MKRTSTEAHVYMLRHQGAKVEHVDVSNVIYHKFSHGGISYTLNGKNVMLECLLTTDVTFSVSSKLSQPMGKIEFFSTTKNRTNCLIGKKKCDVLIHL